MPTVTVTALAGFDRDGQSIAPGARVTVDLLDAVRLKRAGLVTFTRKAVSVVAEKPRRGRPRKTDVPVVAPAVEIVPEQSTVPEPES